MKTQRSPTGSGLESYLLCAGFSYRPMDEITEILSPPSRGEMSGCHSHALHLSSDYADMFEPDS